MRIHCLVLVRKQDVMAKISVELQLGGVLGREHQASW